MPHTELETDNNLPNSSAQIEISFEIEADKIDVNALWVVRRLRAKGYEAYLTGGCVRDLIMDAKPKDFDVATSAKPEEVKAVFRNCRLIGRRFLLAHIYFPGGKIIETATFRTRPMVEEEQEGSDLLVTHDNEFGTVQEDALRRDFTINGLFYDPVNLKILDFVGGVQDIKDKVIRSIGEPHIRFREDPVRIVRAIKFATRLNFEIEGKTQNAMKEYASEILRCAPARLQEEIFRLLGSGHAQQAMQLMREIGMIAVLMPELEQTFTTFPEEAVAQENYALFIKILNAIDEAVERKTDIPAAVCFTAILLPSYLSIEASQENERRWIDGLCLSWAEKIRLTRNDQDRIRLLLSAISLFSSEHNNPTTTEYLLKKPWFCEGLLLYTLFLYAQNKSLDVIEQWKLRAKQAGVAYKQLKSSSLKLSRFVPRYNRLRRPMQKRANSAR